MRSSGTLSPEQIVETLDHLADGVVVLGTDWSYRYLNEQAARMLGRPREDLVGRNVWSEFPGAVGHSFQRACEEALREDRVVRLTDYFEPLDLWFEARLIPRPDGLLVLFRDTSDLHQATVEMAEYAEQMAEAERVAHFGVWKWDVASGKVRWSEELHRIYGLAEGEFEGTVEAFLSYLHPDDRDRVWGVVESAMQTLEPFSFEERIVRPNGELRLLHSLGRALPGQNGKVAALVGVCNDVTERVEAERALGVSERRTRAIIDNLPSVVTVKDLEGRYLMVNAEFADLISRPVGEILGAECGALFPDDVSTRFRASDQRAMEDQEIVYDEVVLEREDGRRTFATVTFALPDEDGRPAETCTIGTDVTDRHERESERRERLDWERTIHSAIADDRLVVYAQPVVELATGQHASSELLVRMRPPDGNGDQLLQPAQFLPAAERFGLVQEIDAWMLEQALTLGPDTAVEVNLSAVTLCDPAARRRLLGLLEAAGDHRPKIVFEITETVAAQFIEAVCEFADAVAELGFGLALDDFGTGFGSFTYLRRLPLRYLKIDRSFVRHLVHSEDDRRVVKSIIGIADQFGLASIVEGVEDEPTLELLRELGAHFVQGFHLGRPAPVDEMQR
jgi:PAS domain S-box-containing protein